MLPKKKRFEPFHTPFWLRIISRKYFFFFCWVREGRRSRLKRTKKNLFHFICWRPLNSIVSSRRNSFNIPCILWVHVVSFLLSLKYRKTIFTTYYCRNGSRNMTICSRMRGRSIAMWDMIRCHDLLNTLCAHAPKWNTEGREEGDLTGHQHQHNFVYFEINVVSNDEDEKIHFHFTRA